MNFNNQQHNRAVTSSPILHPSVRQSPQYAGTGESDPMRRHYDACWKDFDPMTKNNLLRLKAHHADKAMANVSGRRNDKGELVDEEGELLEERLTAAQRSALFWKPHNFQIPDRRTVFAPGNLEMSLAEFTQHAWAVLEPATPLLWNWHLDAICAHLEAVSTGEIRRLLINVPPGHMKSMLVSVFWPAWVWVHQPSWRVLCASSGLDLAKRDSGKCKDLITSQWFREVFAPRWSLKTDSRARASYQNTVYGLRYAVSIGAATTGFRGNALIIDDPLQVMKAISAHALAESIRWYDTAAASRLADPRQDAIVIIMQRLHHEDLSGHVLQAKLNKYEHLMLPSYFEAARKYHTVLADTERWKEFGEDPRTQDKELLFPALFDHDVLAGAEENMGDLEFAGQHQQRPTPAAGNMFKAEYFCPDVEGKTFWPASLLYDQKIIEAYMCWDTAAKKGVTTDFWAGCLCALGKDGRVMIVPLVLEKMDVPDGEKKVLQEWAKWKRILGTVLYGAPIEEGASNATAVVQNARRLMAHKREQELAFELWRARKNPADAFQWGADRLDQGRVGRGL